MVEEVFEGKVDKNLIKEIWPVYTFDENKMNHYKGTSIKQANSLLDSILKYDEKRCLEEAFFGKYGWYKKINSDGMIKIKLAAMSLGLTNKIFTYDSDLEKQIIGKISMYSQEEQLLMIRSYIKQKMVTYLTLKNYLEQIKHTNCKKMLLYRGINTPYENEKYLFLGMESWTSNLDVAYKFARDNGYVIQKEYRISQIFAGRRSTFKNQYSYVKNKNGFFVRREHEMIVENFDDFYDCSDGKHIKLAIDKEIV